MDVFGERRGNQNFYQMRWKQQRNEALPEEDGLTSAFFCPSLFSLRYSFGEERMFGEKGVFSCLMKFEESFVLRVLETYLVLEG